MAIIRSSKYNAYATGRFITPPIKTVIDTSIQARRATILFRRLNLNNDFLESPLFHKGENVPDQAEIDAWREKEAVPTETVSPNVVPHSGFNRPNKLELVQDGISIIVYDAEGDDQGIDVINLPYVPTELLYNSTSSFATIQPIGRNTPFYHYTGAEDKLEFEIDWHSHDENRIDVITNCRKIEALSKADGYKGNPKTILLCWGEDNVLFAKHRFVVLSAQYRLTQFNKAQVNSRGSVDKTAMMPVQAYQRVVLGRISSVNLSKIDIEYVVET